MTSLNLLNAALVLHICGIVFWAGTTVLDYISFQKFWRIYQDDSGKGRAAYGILSRFGNLIIIGIATLLASGIIMMAVTQGIFASQLWFRIKMLLVLGAIINGIAVGRQLGIRVRKLIYEHPEHSESNTTLLRQVKIKLRRFHITQMLIFLIIFILSIFKFN